MRSSGLALLLSLAILAGIAHAQQPPPTPLAHPEAIEGPWETIGPSGIDGIFFMIMTRYVNKGQIIGRNGRVQRVEPSVLR